MFTRFSYLFKVSYWFIFISACTNVKQHSIKSNLIGHVAEFKYNSMPMRGKSMNKGVPLQTTIYIYEQTNIQQIDSLTGPFCNKINTKLITTLVSDSLGGFSVHLYPGKYSVFVRYDGAYYIPYFSGSNWLSLFEIKGNELTNLDINVRGNSSIQ